MNIEYRSEEKTKINETIKRQRLEEVRRASGFSIRFNPNTSLGSRVPGLGFRVKDKKQIN
jgi:hypothetical protein